MHNLGIHHGADSSNTEAALVQHFGKVGHFYYKIRAEDERVVEPQPDSQIDLQRLRLLRI